MHRHVDRIDPRAGRFNPRPALRPGDALDKSNIWRAADVSIRARP